MNVIVDDLCLMCFIGREQVDGLRGVCINRFIEWMSKK